MHTRTRRVAAGALGAAVMLPLAAPAHEGHSKTSAVSVDPNAPKRVSEATAAAIGLETTEVGRGRVERVARLVGIARPLPDRLEAVAPRIDAIVRVIHVRVGDTVRAGDVVAELDSTESLRITSELAIAQSRAEQASSLLETAREREALARAELDRTEANAESVSQNTLGERRMRSAEARGEVRRLEASLTQATREAEALRRLIGAFGATDTGALALTASIGGVVISRDAVVGQAVDAGQRIVQIVDLSAVEIEAEAPESLLPSLAASRGAEARIRAGSDGEALGGGVVRFVSPVIDPTKRTGALVIDAPNALGALRHGQVVDLAVVLGVNESAVVVPPSAIVREGPLTYVFLKTGDTFVKQDVATGALDDRLVEITHGLVPGDEVVCRGAFSLSQLRGEAPVAPGADHEDHDDGHGHSHD